MMFGVSYLVDVYVFQLRFKGFGFGARGRGRRAARIVFAAGLLFPSHVTSERRLDFGRGVAQFCTRDK